MQSLRTIRSDHSQPCILFARGLLRHGAAELSDNLFMVFAFGVLRRRFAAWR
jgi:hypothetical protein